MINKNFKFRIKNKYHSIELQEQLFKCGYRWIDSNNTRSEFEFKDLTPKDFIFASALDIYLIFLVKKNLKALILKK